MPVSYDYTFAPGAAAAAAQVNANFQKASDAIDALAYTQAIVLTAPYRTLFTGGGTYPTSTAGTLILGPSGASSPLLFLNQPSPLYLASADYNHPGLSTKLRLRAQHFTNTSGPGTTLTVGLYPINSVGAGQATLGSVVSGSTVSFASTAGNTRSTGLSGDFSFPADNHYVIAVANSGTTGGSGNSLLSFQLQCHHSV